MSKRQMRQRLAKSVKKERKRHAKLKRGGAMTSGYVTIRLSLLPAVGWPISASASHSVLPALMAALPVTPGATSTS